MHLKAIDGLNSFPDAQIVAMSVHGGGFPWNVHSQSSSIYTYFDPELGPGKIIKLETFGQLSTIK